MVANMMLESKFSNEQNINPNNFTSKSIWIYSPNSMADLQAIVWSV